MKFWLTPLAGLFSISCTTTPPPVREQHRASYQRQGPPSVTEALSRTLRLAPSRPPEIAGVHLEAKLNLQTGHLDPDWKCQRIGKGSHFACHRDSEEWPDGILLQIKSGAITYISAGLGVQQQEQSPCHVYEEAVHFVSEKLGTPTSQSNSKEITHMSDSCHTESRTSWCLEDSEVAITRGVSAENSRNIHLNIEIDARRTPCTASTPE